MNAREKFARQAFVKLIEPHLARLYRLAFRLSDNPHDAEDLLQDVLAKLYLRCQELLEIESLGPWLARVLYREYVDNWRYRRRRAVTLVADHPFAESPELAESPLPSPDSEVGQQDLNRCLLSLPAEQRDVIMLHDVEGYTLPEIGAITGFPVGTLKSRLHRARKKLRDLWTDGTF